MSKAAATIALGVAAAVLGLARPGGAQVPADGRATPRTTPGAHVPRAGHLVQRTALQVNARLERPTTGRRALEATLASAVIPGGGQWLVGSRRWLVYGVAEVGAWLFFLDRRGESRVLERAYRDLAWSVVGRRPDAGGRDPDFEYFEAMAHYDASGTFDRDPMRTGIQPETDEATYNGSVWSLARAIHLRPGADEASPDSPGYEAALDYYRRHAVPEALTWAWAGREAERRRYADLIDRSDAAWRHAGRALGVILANHVISAVDALVSARLAGAGNTAPDVDVRALPDGFGAVRWSVAVRMRFQRGR